MSSKIRVLSEHTINQIAAGEVVENPSSVVKELVENSLDAGATEICVEIQGGGRQLIRITDNGCGMSSDDALLCLERHATSKIRALDDIYALSTMGFRGEAIPSIAAISKFTLITCQSDALEGTMVVIDGGKILQCCPVARSPGTTIEVKALFFNVPVRKKFQKSPAYDTNEILKILNAIALGYPHIKFQLISNQQSLFSTPKVRYECSFEEKLKQRIESILGSDFAAATLPIQGQEEECFLFGFIGMPAYTRHNRTGQSLFINKRAVTSPLISFAVREGYGTALMTNRHPVYVLHLTVPGELIDVNVHPQKREVRLRNESAIRAMIIRSVEHALQQTGLNFLSDNSSQFNTHFFETPSEFESTRFPHGSASVPMEELNSSQPTISLHLGEPPFPMRTPYPSCEKLSSTINQSPSYLYPQHTAALCVKEEAESKESPGLYDTQDRWENRDENYSSTQTQSLKTPPPRVLATLKHYILVENGLVNQKEGICLIDQRSAHARVIFEKLLLNSHHPLEQQTLLLPYTFETTPLEAAVLLENLEELNKLGISIHQSAPHAFLVDAIPLIFGNSNLEMLIHNLVHTIREFQDNSSFKREIEKQIALTASRAAISNNKRLSFEESQALVNQLMQCKHPLQSPQGKPTFIVISYEELEKKFQT